MKKIALFVFTISLFLVSCGDDSFEIDYTPPIGIQFTGVDETNIFTVGKGVLDYTTTINVKSSSEVKISSFEIYTANAETGAIGSLIEGESQFFEEGVANLEASYTFDNLIENKCIKVVVTDILGSVFEKNLLIKITPSVVFSKTATIETVENYHGPYYASWHNGRVYMRKDAGYKNEIDFSLGDLVDTDTQAKVPSLVNPSKRQDYGLLTMSGLADTKFEVTDLSRSDYDNITRVDSESIASIADPGKDAIQVEPNKVYVFKTSNGRKGLVCILQLTSQTGTIETSEGEWTEDTSYHQASISTKILSQD